MALGSTIADLQERLTEKELMIWWAYRQKWGPLNPVRMFDQGAALVAAQVNHMRGGKATPIDFMPHAPREEKSDEIATPEQFIAAVGGKVKFGR